MAFHVACPITCRKICYCTLGFPRLLKDGFLEEVDLVEEFLKDPWRRRVDDGKIVQVKVPKVVVVELPVQPEIGNVQIQLQKQLVVAELVNGEDASGVELDVVALENASAQSKRLVLEKKAAATSEMVEDLARRLEAGDVAGEIIDCAGEKQGQFKVKIMCCLCLSGEKDGTERASKMLPCRSCGKKYHISCLKSWSQDRDLFHWSSWACPSCRVCEVCGQTGDPNKFMFCRRCDAAYHCYCQQPPHKNVSSGPYLCPKHTKCHSCGSNVPGNGLSVRWFLGYTCCDACGRLFVKGNYCPVCLKVYRDSESTPMVCCDICQRWVHCQCDGISDRKYDEFQVDESLQYACPTCRGDCCQVRNPEEAVVELWRRRDEADKDLIASLREVAGLPALEEIFSISPFSDDDATDLVISKSEYGRSIKFSLKGLVEKSSKKIKHGKKSSKKKYGKKKSHQSSETGKIEAPQDFVGQTDLPSSAYSAGAKKIELSLFQISEHKNLSFPGSSGLDKKLHSTNQTKKHKSEDEVIEYDGVRTSRMFRVKNSTSHEQFGPDAGSDMKSGQGPKLVIHLGSRDNNSTDSLRSDASSSHKELDTSSGSEESGNIVDKRVHATASKIGEEKEDKADHTGQLEGSKSKVKIRKSNPDIMIKSPMFGSVSTPSGHILLGKRVGDQSTAEVKAESEVPANKGGKLASLEYDVGHPNLSGVLNDANSNNNNTAASSLLSKDSRSPLKLKFKKPHQGKQVSWINPKDDEMSLQKGQRSKRKRQSPSRERASAPDVRDSAMDEIMDANWILQKLGKDAVGKRVEVHQATDNSWHRGTVGEVFEGTSVIAIALDDGNSKNLELGKQGVRFVSQKRKS